MQTVLDGLPSSSSAPSKSPNVAVFGELLVDLIWAVDSELDEILADAKLVLNAAEQDVRMSAAGKDEKDGRSMEQSDNILKATHARQNAEKDKESLAVILRKLLVGVPSDIPPARYIHLLCIRLRA